VSGAGGRAPGVALNAVFVAQGCTITQSHVEITCMLAPGVGGGLQFSVSIAGRSSAVACTSYRPPTITAMGLLTTQEGGSTVDTQEEAVGVLRTAGGQVLVFFGDNFGPAQSAVPISAVGSQRPDALVGSESLRTTNCAVVGRGLTEVHCVTPPGVGVGYRWVLMVAGQASAPSAQATSYGPPAIVSVAVTGIGSRADEPLGVPTTGGATVTLTGVNFGNNLDLVGLVWNGVPLGSLVMTSPHTGISFLSPPGQGPTVSLVLVVGGRSTVLGPDGGSGGPFGQLGTLSFGVPRVTRVTLTRDAVTTLLDCSSVAKDGRPTRSTGIRVILALEGSNFGDGSGLRVDVGDVPCTALAGRVTHTHIDCATEMCRGARC
jgi:hypothetical protein